MPNLRRRVVGLISIALTCTMLGCGDGGEVAKPVGAPVEISPGMEKMKEEMIQSFKTKSLGKTTGTTKRAP